LVASSFVASRRDSWFDAIIKEMRTAAERAEIDRLMRDIDRSLLRANLKLTFEQRAEKHLRALQMAEELRRAGRKLGRPSDGR
jgi:hypothetical protein